MKTPRMRIKDIPAVLLAMLFAGSLAVLPACGGGEEDDAADEAAEAVEQAGEEVEEAADETAEAIDDEDDG